MGITYRMIAMTGPATVSMSARTPGFAMATSHVVTKMNAAMPRQWPKKEETIARIATIGPSARISGESWTWAR